MKETLREEKNKDRELYNLLNRQIGMVGSLAEKFEGHVQDGTFMDNIMAR